MQIFATAKFKYNKVSFICKLLFFLKKNIILIILRIAFSFDASLSGGVAAAMLVKNLNSRAAFGYYFAIN